MLNRFPAAPDLSKEMKGRIKELGKLWAQDPLRPRLKSDVLQYWRKLVSDWANDSSLPLYVRKQSNAFGRGSIIPHSGRSLVLTDNSPAQWAFVQSYQERKPSRKAIAVMVNGNQVPVAIALKNQELKRAPRYTCLLREFEKQAKMSINSAGWYLAHIDDVELNGKLDKLDISRIREHFIRFMTPSNMFLIPGQYCDLAEVPEFCEQIKSFQTSGLEK
jgi:hypothetical protein